MIELEWSDELLTGNDQIDHDHKKLIVAYHQAVKHGECGVNDETIGRRVSDLHFYFSQHFLREENMMAEISYPAFIEHAREHERIIQRIVNLSHDAKTGAYLQDNLKILVLHWLVRHVDRFDRHLATFIQTTKPAFVAPHRRRKAD